MNRTPHYILALLTFCTFLSCQNQNEFIDYNEAIQKCQEDLEERGKKGFAIPRRKCLIGAKFPEISGLDLNNKEITLNKSTKKYTLLNLWYLECHPCIEEIPILNKLNESKNIEVKSICKNSAENIKEFLERRRVNYKILPNGTDIIKEKLKFNLGYPTSYLIDHNGGIIDVFGQLREDSKEMEFLNSLE